MPMTNIQNVSALCQGGDVDIRKIDSDGLTIHQLTQQIINHNWFSDQFCCCF